MQYVFQRNGAIPYKFRFTEPSRVELSWAEFHTCMKVHVYVYVENIKGYSIQ